MLPDIHRQKRGVVIDDRGIAVGALCNDQFFIDVKLEPCPAGTKQGRCRIEELLFEALKTPEVTLYQLDHLG